MNRNREFDGSGNEILRKIFVWNFLRSICILGQMFILLFIPCSIRVPLPFRREGQEGLRARSLPYYRGRLP